MQKEIKKYFILLLILGIFSQINLYAQLPDNSSSAPTAPSATSGEAILEEIPYEIHLKVKSFFSFLMKDDVDKAFKQLLDGSPIEKETKQIELLKATANKAKQLYGPVLGFDPVNSEYVTENFLRVRYLGLHSKFPMRWIFTFYKSPEKGWIVTNVKFDDSSEYFFKDE